MESFGALNWTILIVYVLANLLLGLLVGRKIDSDQDFYLGRRQTPWWAIGISVIATYVSALSFLGGPAWAYDHGLAVMAIHLNYPLVIVLVITFFLPFFYNAGVASIYDYQEKRFGPAARSVISAIFLISQALTSAAVLYATALVLEFITGIDVVHAILIVSLVALVYTMLGGITAVIWTDVIQAGILLIGALIIFAALIGNLPAPFLDTLSQLKDQGKINPLDLSFDFSREATIWSGVAAMTLFHITVYGANQMMVQRTLAAKSIGDAKKAYLMMGFGAFFIYFLFLFMGVLFYAYYGGREFANGNTIILSFAADYGLPGLMGIIASAVVAASMSSLDSSFNSMATVSTVDFYQRYIKRDGTAAHYLAVSRGFTLLWAVAIVLPAIAYSHSEGSILQTLSKVGSYFVGAKLSMYTLGFFSKHTTERGLLIGVGTGFIVVWLTATQTDIAWPWYCAIGAAVNMSVSWTASLALTGRQAAYSPYSVKGMLALTAAQGLPAAENGWQRLPGRIDRASYWLLAFFAATIAFLWAFPHLL